MNHTLHGVTSDPDLDPESAFTQAEALDVNMLLFVPFMLMLQRLKANGG